MWETGTPLSMMRPESRLKKYRPIFDMLAGAGLLLMAQWLVKAWPDINQRLQGLYALIDGMPGEFFIIVLGVWGMYLISKRRAKKWK